MLIRRLGVWILYSCLECKIKKKVFMTFILGCGVLRGQLGTFNQVLRNVPLNIQTADRIKMVTLTVSKILKCGSPGTLQGPPRDVKIEVPFSFFQVLFTLSL